MAKYYCVLFDADNTLLNFDAAESKALAETLVNYGIEPDAETVQTYRTINSELWRQLEKGQIKREKLMAERFTRFLKAIDAAGDGAEMNRFYLEQLSTHPDLMGPEVLDVLRELSEVATLAVVTNGFQKVQIRRLAESGVLNFMEDVFVSEKMDSEKPNRRIFDASNKKVYAHAFTARAIEGISDMGIIRGSSGAADTDYDRLFLDGKEQKFYEYKGETVYLSVEYAWSHDSIVSGI